MKIVISDVETGKAFNLELDEKKAGSLVGSKIGDEFDANPLGLKGYKLKITGGSDKDGFPMRYDAHGTGRPKILLSTGPGYRRKEKGIKTRRRVRGNVITPDIVQVNAKIIKKGKVPIDKFLGSAEEEEAEPEAGEAGKKEEQGKKKPEEKVREKESKSAEVSEKKG